MLDGDALEDLHQLWSRIETLSQTLENMPYAEGLKPLKQFTSFDEMMSMAGESLLCDLSVKNKEINAMLNQSAMYLHDNGTCKSLNYHMQPCIAVVYGPTGCGKSQLLRNLMSSQLIQPSPETVFFITPQVDMIPPQEVTAWKTQICEGNFQPGSDNTVVPQSGALVPSFQQMSYAELTDESNYDLASPSNIFAKAAARGPIAIIMDECMEDLGNPKGVAKFFHAFPSKLHDRFPMCTGYTVIVVLHNMNPRRDQGGNIANLKMQAKMHLMSPKVHPSQLNRFINTYTKGLPTAMSMLLKDIFNYYRTHSKFDWIIYNTDPPDESMQWMYMSPTEGLMPLYLNVQHAVYRVMQKIHKVLNDRQRWTRYYHAKKK